MEALDSLVNFAISSMWFWMFFVLLIMAGDFWLAYVREHFKRKEKWVIFELRMPREFRKTPKSMDQVFIGIHALKNNPSNPEETWWTGEVTRWFSCEVVSFGGEIHFFMRLPARHRNMMESLLYSQCPDIEVTEVQEDYINRFPATIQEMDSKGLKLYGSELTLTKDDAYPIRTYLEFEANEEEKELDPISGLLETLSNIDQRQSILIQILIRPVTDESWQTKGKVVATDLKEKTGKMQIESKAGKLMWTERTPGELEMIKAIERNLAKPGFETVIRYVFISPEEIYTSNFGQRAVPAAFNQYGAEHLNKFRHNTKVWTRAQIWYWPHLFPKRRLLARREHIWSNYRKRKMYDENFSGAVMSMKTFHWGIGAQKVSKIVLNTEELATLFHPPTYIVLTGPLIKRVEARKVGPPAGLPIYGNGEEKLPGVK